MENTETRKTAILGKLLPENCQPIGIATRKNATLGKLPLEYYRPWSVFLLSVK